MAKILENIDYRDYAFIIAKNQKSCKIEKFRNAKTTKKRTQKRPLFRSFRDYLRMKLLQSVHWSTVGFAS